MRLVLIDCAQSLYTVLDHDHEEKKTWQIARFNLRDGYDPLTAEDIEDLRVDEYEPVPADISWIGSRFNGYWIMQCKNVRNFCPRRNLRTTSAHNQGMASGMPARCKRRPIMSILSEHLKQLRSVEDERASCPKSQTGEGASCPFRPDCVNRGCFDMMDQMGDYADPTTKKK